MSPEAKRTVLYNNNDEEEIHEGEEWGGLQEEVNRSSSQRTFALRSRFRCVAHIKGSGGTSALPLVEFTRREAADWPKLVVSNLTSSSSTHCPCCGDWTRASSTSDSLCSAPWWWGNSSHTRCKMAAAACTRSVWLCRAAPTEPPVDSAL
ncbi:hypothetical protein EYF80_065424 [Liparis tanakae]|uniref:Uncharacterized protein n=1 Tax=Liparis tanakae TaxID=230148 RepID=A0A4Z2E6R7_9TELE|nr:hypothetical protein EYF80_065424 [Liparis tanakae]